MILLAQAKTSSQIAKSSQNAMGAQSVYLNYRQNSTKKACAWGWEVVRHLSSSVRTPHHR